jgi:hypothetical protein
MPKKSSEAIERLASYDFEDPKAESEFQELLAQLQQVQRLEHYIRREGSLFRGHTPLDLKESQFQAHHRGNHRNAERASEFLAADCPPPEGSVFLLS